MTLSALLLLAKAVIVIVTSCFPLALLAEGLCELVLVNRQFALAQTLLGEEFFGLLFAVLSSVGRHRRWRHG